ncbi:MAG: hypothetical protein IT225_10755 [Flavobacteriales bacterium]|jgi:hypothetical protein|nr:hypothetical protein [Flavobacteriales bacterium]
MNTAKRILLTSLVAVAAIATRAQATIDLKGCVRTLVSHSAPVRVHLSVNGVETPLPVYGNGGFKVTVREGQIVVIRATCDGFISKEVAINTENASLEKERRKVKFEVELEAQDSLGFRRYIYPVGQISFDRGTGRLLVQHNKTLFRDEQPLVARTP